MAFLLVRLRELEKTHLLLARCVSVLIHQGTSCCHDNLSHAKTLDVNVN